MSKFIRVSYNIIQIDVSPITTNILIVDDQNEYTETITQDQLESLQNQDHVIIIDKRVNYHGTERKVI